MKENYLTSEETGRIRHCLVPIQWSVPNFQSIPVKRAQPARADDFNPVAESELWNLARIAILRAARTQCSGL